MKYVWFPFGSNPIDIDNALKRNAGLYRVNCNVPSGPMLTGFANGQDLNLMS